MQGGDQGGYALSVPLTIGRVKDVQIFFLRLTGRFVRCLLLECNILNVLQNVNTGYHPFRPGV